MKITKGLSLTAIFVLALGFATQTGWAGEVKAREGNQQDRIARGIDSGQLTAGEAARLEKGEQRIEANRQKALADGKITRRERRKLNRQENRESRRIFKAKHNTRTR